MSKQIVARANFLVFAVLIGFLALIGALTWDGFATTRSARGWTEHTYTVLATLRDLRIALRDAETGERGYLLTGGDDYLAPYQAALGRISILEGDLQQQTADNPAQQARLRSLVPTIQSRLEQFAQTIQVRRDSGPDAAIQRFRDRAGHDTSQAIEAGLTAMTAEEQTLLSHRLAAVDEHTEWVHRLVLAGVAVAILALLWAARMLNHAWSRSAGAEATQRALAGELRASLDSLSQGVAVFGPAFRLNHWNECFQTLLAVPPAMLRVDMPYAAFVEFAASDGGEFLETEDQVRHGQSRNGEPVVYERTRTDGQVLEIRRTPTPGNGFILTLSDMTKRTQSEAVLRESQKMQAIGQLTGGIAHDFNNLLTAIMGNLELARTRLDPQHPVVTHIERSLWAAQRGGTLTSQLLAFARRQPLSPTAIDLSATFPELLPLLRRTLGEHIEVRFVDTAGLWPAMADPAQLESAVLNLALNARDAMPGGGRLTIELANKVLDEEYARSHAEVTAGDYVMVAVSDTGHGMTPDLVARAFEPFFTTKTEGRGTGLGLAMVFGFVKQSGGHVKIYSEPGEGTAVKIYLPRAVGAQVPTMQRSSAPAELPRGSATILLVEDEAAVREVAGAILRNLGYRVLEAQDGDEGLLVFGAHAAEVDLLLTDVVLPGKVRGRELSERITAMRPEVKVLYMSGYTENSIVHHGRLDDGVQLLGKPFKREQLARKVADVLGVAPGAGPENVVDLRTHKRE
ncbi:CHASE3 domain-containing protein [Rhodopila globiformis]|uniref:histidine kinase n=1 Tax=Rhodopila globiformis TaxID=1071 RepID=A0A2S6N075_RHOGL|nr:CHASE3 domain-containing protein [Rhodopila globiformis]PPQ27998.1 histidine kinase [Rhodopila globiformis]